MFTRAELDDVIPLVRANIPPTPQYAWPLLKALTGVDVVVKHENHTPIGVRSCKLAEKRAKDYGLNMPSDRRRNG